MTKIRKSSIVLATVVGAVALFQTDHFSTTMPRTFLSQAEARVGRPLTPVSVAGVARRTTRRAVAAGAIGYGAYAGYSGYYGMPGYANYGYSGNYGTPSYANYYASSAGGDDTYCSSRYRSYDPASGTYLGYDGIRHPCP